MNLHDYSAIVISISGGKDSQTILDYVMSEVRRQQYSGDVIAVLADTGAEWPQSLPHCQMLCDHYRIELRVALPHRALPDHIERRCAMMAEKNKNGWPSASLRDCTGACKRDPIQKVIRAGWPSAKVRYCTTHCKSSAIDKTIRAGWPSSSCKYCTSDCKRNPIQKLTRQAWPADAGAAILSVTGERREESRNRAKLPEVEQHKALTVRGRVVTSWRPILDFTLADVWARIAKTGLPRHVAYDLGNERLSCAICVLAKDGDIRNGAVARPDLAERYLNIERTYGQTFKHKRSLADILKGGAL